MNAIELLEEQHRKVESLFSKLEKGKGDAAPLIEELAENLAAHMIIEQEILYPYAVRTAPDLVHESFEEHALAEIALKRFLSGPRDESFHARLMVFKELVQHHVKEEEEELFPKLEREAQGDELQELGQRMRARFEEVIAAGLENALPKGLDQTSSDLMNPMLGGRPAARAKTIGAKSSGVKSTSAKSISISAESRSKKSGGRASSRASATRGKATATQRSKPTARGARTGAKPKRQAGSSKGRTTTRRAAR